MALCEKGQRLECSIVIPPKQGVAALSCSDMPAIILENQLPKPLLQVLDHLDLMTVVEGLDGTVTAAEGTLLYHIEGLEVAAAGLFPFHRTGTPSHQGV